MTPRRIAALVVVAALVMVASASTADTLSLTLVSQNNTTITLGWTPKPGYGYLFSADGNLVSRTNDASRSTVKFSKSFSTYEVAVIVKGAIGTYPPPPPPAQCADGVDNDGDGLIDLADPGCSNSADNDETNAPASQCSDGVDNDADGKIDYPADPGCSSATDNDETNITPTGCAYPNYPNSTCTGVPAGTTLTPGSGTLTVSIDGAVVNGRDQAGTIYVNANNVTVQNSRATLIVVNTSRTGTVIKDTEVNCPNTGKGIMGGNSSGGGDPAVNLTVTRVDIQGCEDGLVLGSNVTVTDSWLHDPGTCCNDPHNDGMQFLSAVSNVRIEHNSISWRDTSDLQMCNNTGCGTFSNVLIRHNYLNLAVGGAYNIYCPKNPSNNFVIDSNAFQKGSGNFGYFTDCGGETLTGNFEYQSGNPIP